MKTKKKNKETKIIALLKLEMKANEIAKQTGAHIIYVYQVKAKFNKSK
jgi:hypothetical protein